MNKFKATLWFTGAAATLALSYVVTYYFGGLVANYVIVPMVNKGMECLVPKEAEEESEIVQPEMDDWKASLDRLLEKAS